MRIEKTDRRERLWEDLRKATGHGHTSKALDDAAQYYVRMRGKTEAQPTGVLEELLSTAREEGSLTEEEIADILDSPEIAVTVDRSRSISGVAEE